MTLLENLLFYFTSAFLFGGIGYLNGLFYGYETGRNEDRLSRKVEQNLGALEEKQVDASGYPAPDYCTDPNNCSRCLTHPDHREGMCHAGIGKYPN